MREKDIEGRGIKNPEVLAAYHKVRREDFVPPELKNEAYDDHPLPIGFGQTISQPYITVLMTELINLQKSDRVLEIGTGSGYQTALLAELAQHVYSVENVIELGKESRFRLEKMGYENISIHIGDGYQGWSAHAPYDAIIVTAAPSEVPQDLIDQLKPGARLVIPVGSQENWQMLKVITKLVSGEMESKDLIPVRFVPLTHNNARD